MFYPPSTFEKNATSPCELCGEERKNNELIESQGHRVCPKCAQLIRNDGIVLPSSISRKQPLIRAILIQLRDLIVLFCIILLVINLAISVSNKDKYDKLDAKERLLQMFKDTFRRRPAGQLLVNHQSNFTLNFHNGSVVFSIIGNGVYWEIIAQFNRLNVPIDLEKIQILQNGYPMNMWLCDSSNQRMNTYGYDVTREKTLHLRCIKWQQNGNDKIELVIDKNFVDGNEYTLCPLSYKE